MKKITCCVKRVLALWNSRRMRNNGRLPNKTTSIAGLPDELVIEILSRLPAEDVVVCKLVCSSWHRLTGTPRFAETHLMRATPVILGRIYDKHKSKETWFLINDSKHSPRFTKVEVKGSNTLMQSCGQNRRCASCNGLLIFGVGKDRCAISNPVTREEIAFGRRGGGKFHGFYFHALANEYKLLIYQKSDINEYSVYGLSSKDRRTLEISTDHGSLSPGSGVFTCGALFWITTSTKDYDGITVNINDILMFDVDTEQFVLKPQPAEIYRQEGRFQAKLLEIDGKLGCCDVYPMSVEVWILEDIESWKWVKRYVVDLNGYINKDGDRNKSDAKTSLLGIQDGNILLNRTYVGLLWCNLRGNKVRKINTGNVKLHSLDVSVKATQHINSFVSLKLCNILSQRKFLIRPGFGEFYFGRVLKP